jgi:hypothetical protein
MGFAITGHVKGESVAGRMPCDMEWSAVSFFLISRENSCTPRSTFSTASSALKRGGSRRLGLSRSFAANLQSPLEVILLSFRTCNSLHAQVVSPPVSLVSP